MDIKELRFEEDIETSLLTEGGYTKGSMDGYNKQLALNVEELIDFIKETQPKQWKRYQSIYTNPKESLVKRFDAEAKERGLLDVLRNGFKDRGVQFYVVFFKPESNLNEELSRRYESNRLKVIRQFAYSSMNNNTIDMILMLNGIPIVGLELKDQLTGQSIDNAKKQWEQDRNPNEKPFHFNQRFLVYFAVDLMQVAMATELKKNSTYFLPFNQGSNGPGNDGGAGNPENPSGYMTAYLWETVLERHSLLMLIQRFIHLETKTDKNGNEVGQTLIFPRYHQYDVVNKLVGHARRRGPGDNYLIQHSAGSGKSYSIAWLAYRLSTLFNTVNEPVYNSVIVVTDRRVLDRQLQNTIRGLDHTEGVVAAIDDRKSSKDLQEAIESGRKIIITTLQKFPYIVDEVKAQVGKSFAVIVDEAHSSQSGKSAHQLKATLSDSAEALQEMAEYENRMEDETEDEEDKIARIMASQGKQPNLTFFGFTATPKKQTLEMFGKKIERPGREEPGYQAHHIYSMRQAIEEGFILDVLDNYMTYEVSYQIANSTLENPEVEQSKAVKTIGRYAGLHETNIEAKTEIMVEHFMDHTRHKINGNGKAMVVTPSRLHAVRYFKAFQKYIKRQGYEKEIGVLVAFSGVVRDGGFDYTESNMNKTKDGQPIKETEIPAAFDTPEFNILIVAEKFQTGFDQPLLHTMFVDKRLRGIKAVQTLSRLNRISKDKRETYVLDFANEAVDMKEAFEPYYQVTELEKGTDINSIYSLQANIREYGVYNTEDVNQVVDFLYKHGAQTENDLGILVGKYRVAVEQFSRLDEEKRYEFKVLIRRFIKNYAYITQIAQLFDRDLEKEYTFLTHLNKLLPKEEELADNTNIKKHLELQYYKLEKSFEGSLSLNPDSVDSVLKNPSMDGKVVKEEEAKGFLNDIIHEMNDRFQANFDESNRVQTEILHESFIKDDALRKSAQQNNERIYMESIFSKAFDNSAMENLESNPDEFESLFQDSEVYDEMKSVLAKYTYKFFRNVAERV